MGKLTIRLFGTFRAERDGTPIAGLHRREGKKLLAYLILHRGAEITYRTLAERFWPAEALGTIGGAGDLVSTRQGIHALRSALGPDADCLKTVGKGIVLFESAGIDIDLVEFDEATASGDPVRINVALAHYRGPLLEDWSEPWVVSERLRRQQAFEKWGHAPGSDRSRDSERTPVRHNLPYEADSFIGREEEIERLGTLFRTERMVTLSGVGGCGKTRLALAYARRCGATEDRVDQIALTELASLREPGAIVEAIGLALGHTDTNGPVQIRTLISLISDRRLLLIIDNCEHQQEICAEICTEILRSCPNTRLLATSRAALHVTGEHMFSLETLTVPDPDIARTADAIRHFDSVRLFSERAASLGSGFSLTDANARDVAEICWHLDGLPLALELAAGRVRSLSVAEIKDRLMDRFRLLTGGERNRPARQQTLRALMDWSFDLLTEDERRLFLRLSVFVGGATAEAATAMVSDRGTPSWEVADLLRSLTEQSLIRAEVRSSPTRYSMLETVRQYGWERLAEGGEWTDARKRHRDFFLAFAETGEWGTSREQTEWLTRLDAEYDNLRAALEWSAQQTVGEAGEAVGRLLRSLAALGRRPKPVAAVDVPAVSADTFALGEEIANLGQLAGTIGQHAVRNADGGVERFVRPFRERWWNALAFWETVVTASRGVASASLTDQIRSLREETGENEGELSGGRLGNLALYQGDYATAVLFYEDALRTSLAAGDLEMEGFLRNRLGTALLHLSDAAHARHQFEQSEILNRSIGSLLLAVRNLIGFGELARTGPEPSTARVGFGKALRLVPALRRPVEEARLLEHVRDLLLAELRVSEAICLQGAAEVRRERSGRPMGRGEWQSREAFVRSAVSLVGEAEFERGVTAGRLLSWAEIIDRAERRG
ncbi:MAG: NB-ARC domain-containing protein [Capsulimonadales bacterium]|nr:NB-ARC domain-containing protein [Capsulimonadales bacterium]